MGSRIRENPDKLYECFCEVVIPSDTETKAWILQKYPEDFENPEMLKSVPDFACPCSFTNEAVQHFSFVLTSLDSKWTYGFCRHTPKSPTLFVLLSFLPWHETFYRFLNQIAELTNDMQSGLFLKFLESLYDCQVPEAGTNVHIHYGAKEFLAPCPNHLKLPSIPENRNLTEYFNAVDAHNMMIIFASMLHERRIIVTSRKLSRLSACVQAANSLIYPMHWQHIFIPILPRHLLDYVSAPMPFLIGIPSVTMSEVKQSELGEVVVLDADNNRVKTPFKDFETLPPEIVSSLKRRLKNPNMMLGDGVARAFMRALVHLIGGYRDSLKMNPGENITFNEDAFIKTRPSSIQPFLETMLHLQIFHQFIDDRLDMLNSGIGFSDDFELEVNTFEVNDNVRLKYQYKEWVATMKKESGTFLKNVKSKTNPAVKSAYKSVKNKSRRAYKDLQSKIREMQRNSSQPDLTYQRANGQPKSAPSSPSIPRTNSFEFSSRLSYANDDRVKHRIVDGISLSNSKSVVGTRKYKMLTVDEISFGSEDSDHEENTHMQSNMDLMGDLQDIIFRRCSTSSDGPNVENVDNNEMLKENKKVPDPFDSFPFGFEDSFCSATDNDVFLPLPIPPPRTKRKLVGVIPKETPVNQTEEPLIKLDSLDDDSLFDPLKSNESTFQQLSQCTPSMNPCVNELKAKFQNMQPTIFSQSSNFAPLTAGTTIRFVPQPIYSIANISDNITVQNRFQFSNLPTQRKENLDQRPPLPPKKPNLLSTNRLSQNDKDLLDDYGLGSAPIFRGAGSGNVTMGSVHKVNANEITRSGSCDVPDKDHIYGTKDCGAHPMWQKFS